MGPIGCPETLVRNYHYSLRNSPQKCASQNSGRSFLHNFGKRQTFMNYRVCYYFYRNFWNFNFAFFFGSFATDCTGPVIWGVICLLSLDHWIMLRLPLGHRRACIHLFLVYSCPVQVQTLQRSSHSPKESHQAWTNKIRNPETRWPWSTPTSSTTEIRQVFTTVTTVLKTIWSVALFPKLWYTPLLAGQPLFIVVY
jgi:hypothetical protein